MNDPGGIVDKWRGLSNSGRAGGAGQTGVDQFGILGMVHQDAAQATLPQGGVQRSLRGGGQDLLLDQLDLVAVW